jgi:thioredoxin-related protein
VTLIVPRFFITGHFFLTFIFAALLPGSEVIAEELPGTREPREFFFAQTFGDLPEELAEARQAGKLGLFLFYEQEGCVFCLQMMRSVLNQRDVQAWYRERFVNIAVDIRGDVELRDVDGITLPSKVFAEHRKVKYTPVMSFLDLNGVEIFRNTGTVTSPEEFLLMGRYIVEQRYTDTPFRDYLAEKGLGGSDQSLRTPANGD